MTVLIVAAGDSGQAAARALADREVRRVETVADARAALDDATAALVGEPADRAPGAARDAARAAGVPAVRLGADGEGYDAVADPADAGAVRTAVDLAEHAAEYRAAVDEFYEQCRAHASGEGGPDADDLRAARDRAHRRLRDLREATGRTPYENLLGSDAVDDPGDGDGNDPGG